MLLLEKRDRERFCLGLVGCLQVLSVRVVSSDRMEIERGVKDTSSQVDIEAPKEL